MAKGLGRYFSSKKNLTLFLILSVFLVYLNSLPNGFAWDDFSAIANNKVIHSFSNFFLLFKGSVFYTEGIGGSGLSGWLYRPIYTSYMMIVYFLSSGRPFGFHLFQLVLHVANTVLVFFVFRKLFKGEKMKWKEQLAFGAALIYGVHPVNVESVAYIAATNEVLYAFFWLMSFWFVLREENWAVWLSLGFFLLALLSKESAIVGGGVVLLYLLLFERKKFIRWLVLFLFAIGFYFWLRLGVARIPLESQGIMPIMEASLKERLLTIPWEFFSYLRLIFWPQVLAIAQHFVVKEPTFRHFWLPLGIDLLFLGSLLAWGLKNGSKLYWFFVVWFLAPLGLVMNIIPLDFTVAEHWLYFPLIGFLGGFGLIVVDILKQSGWFRRLTLPLFLVIIVALSFRTVVRNFDWRTPFSLYHHDVQYSRYAFDIENNLGAEYYKRDELDKAQEHFKRSIVLQPKDWAAYANLGAVWERKGDLDAAEVYYRQAIENGKEYLGSGNLATYESLVRLLFIREDYKEGERFLREGLRKYPESEGLDQLKLYYFSITNNPPTN